MAWVRPKHPPPKPKADPVDTLVPMLSYFSNRRVTSRPTSPNKQNAPPPIPISRDPILRSFQQAQALHAEELVTDDDEEDDDEDEESYHEPPPPPIQRSRQHKGDTRQERPKQHHQRISPQYSKEKSPPRPQPPLPSAPRIDRPQARVSSYERYRPVVVMPQEKIFERHVPYAERASSRAVSARWASATTPLDLR